MQQPQQRLGDKQHTTAILYQRHAPALFSYLRLHASSWEDAEDLLVEVFLAALQYASFPAYSEEEQRLWLWRVAHNKVADYYRLTKRREVLPLDDMAETVYADDELAPEQLSLRREEHAHLWASIKRLSELQQQVLRLRFVHGMRCSEIATILGKREGAVRMLLSRTLNLLRTIYEKL